MTGYQRLKKFLAATVEVDGAERTIDYLSYATIDGAKFGIKSKTAFLVDGKIGRSDHARWAETLLSAGRGVVKIETQPRARYSVTFRIADGAERDQAWTRIHEVRPSYNLKMDPGEVRVILVELDED